MENLIQYIMPAGTEGFTPEVLIRFMVFVLIVSCISSIASDILSVGK